MDKVFDCDNMFKACLIEGLAGKLWACWQILKGNVASIMLIVPSKQWCKQV